MGPVGLFLGAFMLVILLVRGRRGHDTMPSRGMDTCGTSGTGRSSGGRGPWPARRPSHSCSFSSWCPSRCFRCSGSSGWDSRVHDHRGVGPFLLRPDRV